MRAKTRVLHTNMNFLMKPEPIRATPIAAISDAAKNENSTVPRTTTKERCRTLCDTALTIIYGPARS